jgi:RNA polymerase sigma-70 factor (ECF subfamily)
MVQRPDIASEETFLAQRWKVSCEWCDIDLMSGAKRSQRPSYGRIERESETSQVIEKPSLATIAGAKQRDPQALVAFFARYERQLFAYFSGPMHWHWSFVPDLVQETITRAIKSFPRLRGDSQPEAERWLFGIARNVHMQSVTRQVGIRLRRDVASDLAKYLQRTCEAVWYRPDINNAISELPLAQLEVLRLLLEGLTLREIASRLDIPEGTVATRIHRARKRLAERLGVELSNG